MRPMPRCSIHSVLHRDVGEPEAEPVGSSNPCPLRICARVEGFDGLVLMKEAFPNPVHPRWRRGKSGGTTLPRGLDSGPLRAMPRETLSLMANIRWTRTLFSSWHQSRCELSTQGAGKDLAGPWEVENASVIILYGTFEAPQYSSAAQLSP